MRVAMAVFNDEGSCFFFLFTLLRLLGDVLEICCAVFSVSVFEVGK